jgi:hypothetical protein
MSMVVVGKSFRASTVRTSKSGEIGLPALALKTNEHERRQTCRADRMIVGHQRIKKKVINCAHNRTFGGNGDASLRSLLANELQLDWFGAATKRNGSSRGELRPLC